MPGVILETLSNKKLIGYTVIACICQAVCFLIGGLVSPTPYNVQQLLTVKCVSGKQQSLSDKWFDPWACDHLSSFHDERVAKDEIDANRIVFATRYPRPRENKKLQMSRWHQNVVGVMQVQLGEEYAGNKDILADMSMEVHFGYSVKENETAWQQLALSWVDRQLECGLIEAPVEEDGEETTNTVYGCSVLSFFELAVSHYDYYIINIRLPVSDGQNPELEEKNEGLPLLENIWINIIHQNGGFTIVWVTFKMVLFPALVTVLGWYIYKVRKQTRPCTLLEKMLITLGAAMSLLNLPVDLLALWIYMPYLTLYSDIRQGIFYTVLFCFWIIFAGEHLMDKEERNRLFVYWKHLIAVGFGCIALFVFEMCERGVQLSNPFFSIWATSVGSKMALGFIVVAGIAACAYFLFLLYMIVCVFRNISSKKSSLPQMSKARKRFYLGLIFRFKFLMVFTLVCAAATVIFFIVGQVSEGYWKWDGDQQLQYTSGFLTGVYGMWNIYVVTLLVMYAPSSKPYTEDSEEDEVIEFENLPSETSALTHLAQKAGLD